MKKILWFAGIPLALLCAALVFWCVLLQRDIDEIFYRLHPGERLICTAHITVDGTPCSLAADAVCGGQMCNGTVNRVMAVEPAADGTVIRCAGGEYGAQPFSITIQNDKLEKPFCLPVTLFVCNWWEITEIDMTLSLDTQTDTYTCTGNFRMYHDEKCFSQTGSLSEETELHLSGA